MRSEWVRKSPLLGLGPTSTTEMRDSSESTLFRKLEKLMGDGVTRDEAYTWTASNGVCASSQYKTTVSKWSFSTGLI